MVIITYLRRHRIGSARFCRGDELVWLTAQANKQPHAPHAPDTSPDPAASARSAAEPVKKHSEMVRGSCSSVSSWPSMRQRSTFHSLRGSTIFKISARTDRTWCCNCKKGLAAGTARKTRRKESDSTMSRTIETWDMWPGAFVTYGTYDLVHVYSYVHLFLVCSGVMPKLCGGTWLGLTWCLSQMICALCDLRCHDVPHGPGFSAFGQEIDWGNCKLFNECDGLGRNSSAHLYRWLMVIGQFTWHVTERLRN